MKSIIAIALFAVCFALAVPFGAAAEEPLQVASVAVATINVNTASAMELTSLPGIGEVTADRIVTYRTEHGPFTAVDQLVAVKGIGNKTLEKLRDLVAVE